jgi:hypothetical protein
VYKRQISLFPPPCDRDHPPTVPLIPVNLSGCKLPSNELTDNYCAYYFTLVQCVVETSNHTE